MPDVVALIGAVSGVGSLTWLIYSESRKRRLRVWIRAEFGYGKETLLPWQVGLGSVATTTKEVWIVVYNDCDYEIYLTGVGINLDKVVDSSRRICGADDRFVLGPRQEGRWGIGATERDDLVRFLTEPVRPYVTLEGGREVSGKTRHLLHKSVRMDTKRLAEIAGGEV